MHAANDDRIHFCEDILYKQMYYLASDKISLKQETLKQADDVIRVKRTTRIVSAGASLRESGWIE